MTIYTITLTTKPCNRINLINHANAAGFKVVGDPKHPNKYVCLLCKEEQTKRAGENARPEVLKVAYTTAHLFAHPDGRKMLACCAGHRRLQISDSHPEFEKMKAAALKVERVGGAPKPAKAPVAPKTPTPPPMPNKKRCQGKTAKGAQCALAAEDNGFCRFHQGQAPTTTQNPGF